MAHTSRTLVGRDAELTEIASALGVASSAPGGDATPVVLLAGDAGVGKTRLLTALRDHAVGQGWQVLAGHCLDFGDSALPYLPFSEVLGRLGAERPALVDEVAAAHPVLARLQPGRRVLGARGSEETGQAGDERTGLDRADLFEAVHALLDRAAQDAPLLLVVEDTHWADRSTRDLLSFLFSRPYAARVALVASYRSDDLHRRHPLRRQVAEWSRLRGVSRVALGPLPDDAVRALVAELAPDAIGERELAAIVERAEGNAFFVEELASAAAGPGDWVPADLADVLLVRLDRLDDAARQLVRTASASGRKVTHEALEAASGLDPAALDEGLRQAVEMNVLVADAGGYSFRHALLGEAVHDDLLPGERVRLHGEYAAALRDGRVRGTAAELARHARLALDLDTALQASVRAGHEATAVGGPDEAAYHFQQALELLADPQRERGDLDVSKLVVGAAEALTQSGDPERAVALLTEQLGRLPADAEPVARARLSTYLATVLCIVETDVDPLPIAAEAVALAPPGDSPLRARCLANHARVLSAACRWEEAEAVGLDALALAERLDLSELASDAITTLSGLKKTGPKEGLRSALVDAVARAEAAGAVHAELRGRFFLGRSFEDWAEMDEAEAWFRSALDRAERAGLPWAPYGFESRWQLALVDLLRGRWDSAHALASVAEPSAPPIPRALLDTVRLAVEQGRGADVGAEVRRLRRYWEREGSVAIHAAELELVAAGRAGDGDGVLAAYADAVGLLGRIWHPWFSARLRLAAVALRELAPVLPRLPAGDRPAWVEAVTRLHADGREVLDRIDPGVHWGPEGRAWARRLEAEAARARWLLDADAPGLDALVGAWREAEAAFDELGHVPELARTRIALAGVLRAGGDPASARALCDAARETAHALGAQPLLDELRALGGTPARAEAAPDQLTARETEILGLVAQGRSNGEIGKQLFISTKTVSVHVSHILGKLGAAGRTEAAAIARRRGLVD
ncbi:AAA family ATPase [Nocardioides sp. SOB77]|uniref:AAA family ATPase n=1 Tax=Nocardioides oceani TaxID=3058369 RepID=A0ABT8FFS3_9ACTN|nr:helix-turn-helix transcriptional regulator [Nocardioides oceani]MDN4173426.1 AAA family ATPase [Nocardioides oceani]